MMMTGSPPASEKSPRADNLPVKIRFAQATAGRVGFLPANCRPEGDFFWGRSYNGASAYDYSGAFRYAS